MEKTKNELLGLVSGLVKNGVSIDELYNYIKDKFEVETDKTINDFSSIIKKYKDQYILIDGNNDRFSSLMLVKDIEFSGGRAREYSFHGPIVNFVNDITEDDSVVIGSCGISFDSFDYNHFSTEELDRNIKVLSINEVKALIAKKSVENVDTIMKNFLK